MGIQFRLRHLALVVAIVAVFLVVFSQEKTSSQSFDVDEETMVTVSYTRNFWGEQKVSVVIESQGIKQESVTNWPISDDLLDRFFGTTNWNRANNTLRLKTYPGENLIVDLTTCEFAYFWVFRSGDVQGMFKIGKGDWNSWEQMRSQHHFEPIRYD